MPAASGSRNGFAGGVEPRNFRMMRTPPFYYRETGGIRITVRPVFLAEQSRPSRNHYVFAYFVRIENVSAKTVQLLSRHWYIHDSVGEDTEVEGEGVVGEQPVIAPGHVHEYHSFCVLRSPAGHMEGTYKFVDERNEALVAAIPRFNLAVGSAQQAE